MIRKVFIQKLSLIPMALAAVNLKELEKLVASFSSSQQMPVLFLGHGSPKNAIEENEFVLQFRKVALTIPKPTCILCVSAHWETNGTFVTGMEHPKTIHDFYGFPKELFEVEYPAIGDPQLAKNVTSVLDKNNVKIDLNWGLDHGCWSVLNVMYPKADIPVIQLSLDSSKKDPNYHYELAKQLSVLRNKGVLIIGSGNMVHNLSIMDWNKPNTGFDWAQEANAMMKSFILKDDHQSLMKYQDMGKAFQLSIPTPEHYLPLLYSLALKDAKDDITIFNDKTIMGSISMTSLLIGN